MRANDYADELRRQAVPILENHPGIPHEWRSDALVFLETEPSGFEVVVQPHSHGMIVFSDVGFHEHPDGSPEEATQEALGLVRDLLSPDMRVRELCSGGKPVRWILERRVADGWVCEAQTGLLFWNYFGRRSERIYQNRQLPGRLAGAGADR